MAEDDIRIIMVALARVESKVDGIQDDNEKADVLHGKFDDRISKLEQFRWLLIGAVGASSGAAGVTLAKLIGG